MTFLILLFLNTLFCIVLFLYFRERFQKMAGGDLLRDELGSLISVFNQTADKHITLLDDMLVRASEAEEKLRALLVAIPGAAKQNTAPVKKQENRESFTASQEIKETPRRFNAEMSSPRVEKYKPESPSVVSDAWVEERILSVDSGSVSTPKTTSRDPIEEPSTPRSRFRFTEEPEKVTASAPYDNVVRAARLKKVLDQREEEVLGTLSMSEKIKFLSRKEESVKKIAEKLGVSLTEIQLVLSRSS